MVPVKLHGHVPYRGENMFDSPSRIMLWTFSRWTDFQSKIKMDALLKYMNFCNFTQYRLILVDAPFIVGTEPTKGNCRGWQSTGDIEGQSIKEKGSIRRAQI